MTHHFREERYAMTDLVVGNVWVTSGLTSTSAAGLSANVLTATAANVGTLSAGLSLPGGGPCFTTGPGWSAASNAHPITVSALTRGVPCADVTGTLHVSVSDRAGNVGHVLAVVAQSSAYFEAKPICILAEGMTPPAVSTTRAPDVIVVQTDAGCRVAWTFVSGITPP